MKSFPVGKHIVLARDEKTFDDATSLWFVAVTVDECCGEAASIVAFQPRLAGLVEQDLDLALSHTVWLDLMLGKAGWWATDAAIDGPPGEFMLSDWERELAQVVKALCDAFADDTKKWWEDEGFVPREIVDVPLPELDATT
jgi:hypothetical protein